jgi:hypothetical protein
MARHHKPIPKNLSHGNWIEVTKLEAARRQIDSAIFLYFNDHDFVSVHTLGSAAVAIVDTLLKAKGLPDTVGDLANIRPEFKESVRAMLTEDANFFKHGSKDPDQTLPFKPESNELMLMRGCDGYFRIHGSTTPSMFIFILWMRIWMSQVFISVFPLEKIAELQAQYPRSVAQRYFADFWRLKDHPEFGFPEGFPRPEGPIQ